MKKYKIGNRIITADSIIKAVKISKMLDSSVVKLNNRLHDNDNSEIEYLTEEEERAVEDYRKAIAGTTNPKLLELYKHILDEELEHIQELQEADVKDSVKDSAYKVTYVKNNMWLSLIIKASSPSKAKRIAEQKGVSNIEEVVEINEQVAKRLGFDSVKDSKIKDWAPPYAIWVKKNGKWIIFGGANSTNIDKRRFLNSGYEDVIVVENGKEPTQDCDMKDSKEDLQRIAKKYDFSFVDPKKAGIKAYFRKLSASADDIKAVTEELKSFGYNVEVDGWNQKLIIKN